MVILPSTAISVVGGVERVRLPTDFPVCVILILDFFRGLGCRVNSEEESTARHLIEKWLLGVNMYLWNLMTMT